ncbi:hypothetical protein T492DRAFT_991387 [Pavlovales sp. CCMP2436]|nr:hypothetical protein T492DRAFT_991387 [Pavlovales sp. CCMP2436]|mmetsp:Transcript_43312/g.106973  ORF Transcript_43312/g.106973 Transcript_43312/m.106973 type:complete len:368 (+) Transcript_43312:29-1132(+)
MAARRWAQRRERPLDDNVEGYRPTPDEITRRQLKLSPVALAVRLIIAGVGVGCLFALSEWMREHNVLLSRPSRLWRSRPLLIVGTMGSGTQQMALELGKLGLGVGHESAASDEGTVSWIHGLRLMDDPIGPDVPTLCSTPEPNGWHPMQLEPGHCKADGQAGGWGQCWKELCPDVVRRHYGCELRGGRGCTPQFDTVLLQVRHPLATLASCVRGFCKGGDAGSPAASARLLRVVRAMLPSEPWEDHPSCGGQFALFWLRYLGILRTRVHAWYKVEDTRPCEVLALAGLLNASSPGVGARLHRACAPEPALAATEAATATDGSQRQHHGYHGRHNTDGFAISYDDVELLAGEEVRDELQALARVFGYE